MPINPVLEPLPFRNRALNDSFYTQRTDYLEYQATWGRGCGLLPRPLGERAALPELDPPDVLHLSAIRAIGECGYPIVVDASDVEFRIPPFDTRDLQPGRYRVYACLERDRTPCGPVEEHDDPSGGPPLRAPIHRRARVVLATGPKVFESYRDWIPVATIVRERLGGLVRTRFDASFHPPILDMRAWARARNPLVRLADLVLPLIEEAAEAGPLEPLRVELQALRCIAEAAPPAVVFVQAQRCLGLIRTARLSFVPEGGLESFRFHPDEFASFLVALDDSLNRTDEGRPYPDHLLVGNDQYNLAAGEFVRQQSSWVWTPPQKIEQVNSLALYFPRAIQSELPVMRYGRARDDSSAYKTGTFASDLHGPGCLVLLDDVKGRLERVHLSPVIPAMDMKLERRLLDGHALYYF